MWPEPLHPAVVHFPIVLVVLFPIIGLAALWAIRRGAAARSVWAVPVVVAAFMAGSAWLAVRTGEAEEDRVEAVVGEAPLHRHEEAAERFLVLSGVLLLVAAAGLASGPLGAAGRLLATAGSVGLLVAGVQVGAAGADLVYRHGAAGVYAEQAALELGRGARGERRDEDEREQD